MIRRIGIKKRILAVLAALALTSGLTACFDRRELDTLGIVIGVAIDKGETEGETELTLQIANVAESQSSKQGSNTSKKEESGGSSFFNVSHSGKTVNTILRDLEHMISRRVYIPHIQVIIFGEELAREGVRDSLDFFARAPEARMTLYVFVAKGKAADILNVKSLLEAYPSTALMQRIKNQDITSDTPIVTEFEFVRTMMNKSTAAVLPIVEITEQKDRQRLLVGGCAVFKDSRMVGELDKKETRGLLWVKGEVEAGILSVELMGVCAAAEIVSAKSRVNAELREDGTIFFRITVDEVQALGDQTGITNLAAPENLPALLEESERVIADEIQSALDQSWELQADIFGFGEYISRKYPDKWKDMEDNWDELYQKIEVEIEVNAKADGTGRTIMPLIPE